MLMYRFLKCSVVAAALVSAPGLAKAADAARPPGYRGAPAVPYYDWSGFYVGAHVGTVFGSGDDSDVGFIGGGQAGYNYQVGRYVLGVEGEISATSLKDSVSGTFVLDPGGPGRLPVIGRASAEASLDWISTLSGRFGWVVDPQWLVYGKVGAAWAHVSADAFAGISGGPSVSASFDDTFSGWLLGFGTEYALRDN